MVDQKAPGFPDLRLLFVIPTLNEAAHLPRLLDQFETVQARLGGLIVIVDGGSTDGTRNIALSRAVKNPAIRLLDNPAKLQSAGINRAIELLGHHATHLLRIDAHARYPDDFADRLIQAAKDTGAASVTVSMRAEGSALIQRVNAAAQNAPLGNGGSKHRNRSTGEWVDHGHHALIDIHAFRSVGGYDPAFAANEDAELDYRLTQAGHGIWLTGETEVTYFPRPTLRALARQYFNYGRGRAQNLLKHRAFPRVRQAKVMVVAPALAMATLAPAHPLFAVPAALWAAYCMAFGMALAWEKRDPRLILTALSAMCMHAAWSAGFWARIGRSELRLGART